MMREDTNVAFDATRWSLLDDLAAGGDRSNAARERLHALYWPPVYAFLRRTGQDRERAGELAQAFFTDVVLGRRLFENAHRDAGRLRSLLIASLKRYVIDDHRRRRARGADHRVSSDRLHAAEASFDDDPSVSAETAFDRALALTQLREAVGRCEAYFRGRGKAAHWRAFELRYLQPMHGSHGPPSLAAIAGEAGFTSPADAGSALQVVRKRLAVIIEEIAAESGADGPTDLLARLA